MTSISEKRKEIDLAKGQMSPAEYFSRDSKKLREWDILTSIFCMLQATEESMPQFASEGERPDFQTFWARDVLGPPVEVTETLHPRYRRSDFWRKAERPDAPTYFDVDDELPEPWLPLRKAISKKAQKQYSPTTWLLVYNDIGRSAFPDWGTPLDEQLLSEHRKRPFDFSESFGRVLVMGANMKSLVEIHPTPKSWVPDQWDT